MVSGGHTNIIKVDDYNECKILLSEMTRQVKRWIRLLGSRTRDIQVDQRYAAREGDRDAIKLERVYLNDGSYDFSFSGLRLRNYINSERQAEREMEYT